MGLCLICKSKSWYSSYSNVHEMRRIFIEGALAYLNELEYKSDHNNEFIQSPFDLELSKEKEEQQGVNFFNNEKQQLIYFIKSLLSPLHEQTLPISYDPWTKTPYSLYYFGLCGLKILVNHSDCDGYYSPGDSLNIIELYSRIKKYLSSDYKDLISLFEESYETKSYITFC